MVNLSRQDEYYSCKTYCRSSVSGLGLHRLWGYQISSVQHHCAHFTFYIYKSRKKKQEKN